MKHISTVLFMLGIMSSIFGTFIINRTITIDAVTLAAMRGASLPASHLYDPYIDNLSDANTILMHDDATTDLTRVVPETITKMNDAVNYHLNSTIFDDAADESEISVIVNNFLSYVPSDTVAALAYFRNTSEAADARALHLTYYTINTAMLYDCFFFAPTSCVPNTVKTKLQNILLASIHLTMDSIDSYAELASVDNKYWGVNIPSNHLYPQFSIVQYRLQMFGAMGLAALLLRETVPSLVDEMNGHLNYINNILLNEPIPETFPADRQYQGMLAFHTTNSGAYFESLGYQGQLLQMICPFFTAYKRLTSGAVNYYNNQYIVSWINDLTRKVTPTEADWPYNDDWGGKSINPSPVFFYYNNSDNQDVRNKCSWYLRSKITSGYASYGHACRSYILVKYLSDPFVTPGISSIAYIPTFISQGSSSNSEYSVLRKPINGDFATTLADFRDVATMFVLHENSFSPYHGQSDHLSYSFYYKGVPFLIDPGYRVTDQDEQLPAAAIADGMKNWDYGREWMRSIYAHNMVVVDEDDDKELWELRKKYWDYRRHYEPYMGIAGTYRPFSAFNNYNDLLVDSNDIVRDPCQRDYYQQSDNLDLLRTKVVYDDYTTNSPIAEIQKTFVRYGELYLVLDDIDTLDDNLHEFSSLLQFGVFNQTSYASVYTTTHGFTIRKGSISVDVICGSSGVYENKLDDAITGYDNWYFPSSAKFTSSPDFPIISNQFGHARGRTRVTEAGDTSILAIIAPQEASNPVTIQNTAYEPYAYYGAELLQNTRTIPIQPVSRFFGCTDGSQCLVPFGDKEIGTNAKMYAVSILSNIEPNVFLDQAMVILGGTNLVFNGYDLYREYSGSDKGLTATYTGSSLGVVFHETAVSFPRFKIYRSGADPSLFSAIMRTQLEHQIPEPIPYPDDPDYRYFTTNIVQSLAYDDQYFYVNYSWNDLDAAGLINDELVIVKGEIPIINLNTDLNIQGDVSITGSITINNGASMDVYPNSSILVSDGVGISNHGALNISGGASRTVSIGSASQQWSGVITYRDGSLICDGTVITDATTGIQIRGNSTITNSEISDCHRGISIETGTPFSIDGSLIQNNTYGIVISNNYTTSDLGCIQNNEITQNGIGMLFYNSNTKIALNDIHNNTRAGLYLIRGSEPIVKGCNISFTEQNGLSRPEIRLESDSYPIIDDARNDINADGLGYSLFYDSTGRIKQLMARNNYWGSTNPFGIRQWIYPLDWDVVYDPYSTEPNTFFPHVYDNLFIQALAAEESGDTALAKQLYSTIVATEPDSLYALQSLGRLNSIYSGSPSLLSELRTLYDAYLVACDDSILVKNAQIKSVMIDRFDGMFLQSLQEYDLQLQLSTTELDSLLCLLDIAYTLEDMYFDDLGKGAPTGMTYHANGLNITSLKDARHTVDQLWGEILAKSDNSTSDNVPVPTKLAITNYPNPFNPSTTIAFSLPDEGMVHLSVYNIRGQRVRELIDGSLPRGFHKVVWDGKDNGNRNVSSGLYFVRIETGKTSTVRKIMMLK